MTIITDIKNSRYESEIFKVRRITKVCKVPIFCIADVLDINII